MKHNKDNLLNKIEKQKKELAIMKELCAVNSKLNSSNSEIIRLLGENKELTNEKIKLLESTKVKIIETKQKEVKLEEKTITTSGVPFYIG